MSFDQEGQSNQKYGEYPTRMTQPPHKISSSLAMDWRSGRCPLGENEEYDGRVPQSKHSDFEAISR